MFKYCLIIYLIFNYSFFLLIEGQEVGGETAAQNSSDSMTSRDRGNLNDFPFITFIRNKAYKIYSDFTYCTGAMVSERLVLTTGNCVNEIMNDMTPLNLKTVTACDKSNGFKMSKSRQVRDIIRLEVYPDFYFPENDVGIIEVDTPFSLHKACHPINVAEEHHDSLSSCLLANWGETDVNKKIQPMTSAFRIFNVSIVDDSSCPREEFDEGKTICVKEDSGADLCLMQRGSPLLCGNVLAGQINGRKNENLCNSYEMLSKLANPDLLDWIQINIERGHLLSEGQGLAQFLNYRLFILLTVLSTINYFFKIKL